MAAALAIVSPTSGPAPPAATASPGLQGNSAFTDVLQALQTTESSIDIVPSAASGPAPDSDQAYIVPFPSLPPTTPNEAAVVLDDAPQVSIPSGATRGPATERLAKPPRRSEPDLAAPGTVQPEPLSVVPAVPLDVTPFQNDPKPDIGAVGGRSAGKGSGRTDAASRAPQETERSPPADGNSLVSPIPPGVAEPERPSDPPTAPSVGGVGGTKAAVAPGLSDPMSKPVKLIEISPQPTQLPAEVAAMPVGRVPTSDPTSKPPDAVTQIAPALLHLAKAADGQSQVTLQLHPADLGMVQIRIERAASGMARVEISADSKETLQILQRDQPQLHRTLDEAGVPMAGRTIEFHTAPPASAPIPSNGAQAAGGSAGQGSAPDPAFGNGQSGQPNARRGAGRQQLGTPAEPGSTGNTYRLSLDITV